MPIRPARVKRPVGGMIFILFLVSVATLEAILNRDRKRPDSAPPPDRASDSTGESLFSLAQALGPSTKPEVPEPKVVSVRRPGLN